MNIFSVTTVTITPNATMIKTVQEWAGTSRRDMNIAFDRIVETESHIANAKPYSRFESTVITNAAGGKVVVTKHYNEIVED